MEFSRSLIAMPFLLRRTRMSQVFGSLITSIMNKCSTWWERLTQEKRSLAGTQQAQTSSNQTSRSTKFFVDTTRTLSLSLLEFRTSSKSLYPPKPISHKRKLTLRVQSIANSFMFQVLLEPQRPKRWESSISWETLRMLPKDSSRSKSLIRLMDSKPSLESWRKWGYTWKESSMENTGIITQ